MSVTPSDQSSLYEVTIEDAELEKLLEDRESRKASLSALRAQFKAADDAAKAKLNTLDLGDGAPVRIGRFVVSRRKLKGRSVAFETGDSERLWIGTLPDSPE